MIHTSNVHKELPVSTSHNFAVLSIDPETRIVPVFSIETQHFLKEENYNHF